MFAGVTTESVFEFVAEEDGCIEKKLNKLEDRHDRPTQPQPYHAADVRRKLSFLLSSGNDVTCACIIQSDVFLLPCTLRVP